jgi:hypothetical protein
MRARAQRGSIMTKENAAHQYRLAQANAFSTCSKAPMGDRQTTAKN